MKPTSTIAKSEDGSVQVTLAIPEKIIIDAQEKALLELSSQTIVPGFRKGKAPAEKVKEKIGPEKLLEKTLSIVLPKIYSEALVENKISPVTYPKFELISQGKVWQVRAIVATLPQFDLGNYKEVVAGALRSASLKRELTKEEKEQKAVEALLESVKITIPKILVDDEVNMRLSALLERIEKLGLTLEGYLASIGKNHESIREEYAKQVKEAISMELILGKIADEEKVEISEAEIDKTIKASGDPKLAKGPIRSILRKRAVLDHLTRLM